MPEDSKPDIPIRSQGVRKLTDQEYEMLAKKLLEDLTHSGGKEVTWQDIARAARAVLTAKPKKCQKTDGQLLL